MLSTTNDIGLAYDVQQLNVERAVAAGRRISGRKIGLTSAAIQLKLGINEPDYGALFSDVCIASGVDLPATKLIQPRAQAEIAVVLNRDLDSGPHSVVEIMTAIAYVLPALEIVDSRIRDWDISAVDAIADNASVGYYVVGSRPVSLDSIDIAETPLILLQNGETVSAGQGSAYLGNPLHEVCWLANLMCERGQPLRAGECVMTGALGPMVGIREGDVLFAELGALGSVSTRLPGG